MKTFDPIGLFRFLHPRASGLIVFKGGDDEGTAQESTVTEGFAAAEETGNQISEDIGQVQSDVSEGFTATGDALTDIGADIGTASETGTTTAPGGSFTTKVVETTDEDGNITTTGGETVEYGGGEVDVTETVKGDTEALLGGQSDLSSQIDTRLDTFQPTTVVNQTVDTSDLAKQADMTSGFDTVTGNQGSILSDTGQILSDTGDIKTGVSDVGGQVTDLSGKVDTRFDTVDKSISEGFTGASDQLTGGFADQAAALETLSSNILGGQGSLQEYLEGMSGRQDTYYGGLAEGQAGIQSSVGGLQDNFTQFERQYTDDTTLANQARAELADQVTGGFNLVRDDLKGVQATGSQERAQITRNTEQTLQNQSNMETDFGSALRNISAGVEAQSTAETNTRNDIKQRLQTIREVILAEGQNLDPALSMQFAKFADSFDEAGKLISRSTARNGNVTQRAFDDANNLRLATFDPQGNLLDSSQLNIDEMMSQMDQLGYSGSSDTGLMGRSQPFQSTFS